MVKDAVLLGGGGAVGTLEAVIAGGLSTPILTAEEPRDLLLDDDSCLKAGTMLGSGGIMVMSDALAMPIDAMISTFRPEFESRFR